MESSAVRTAHRLDIRRILSRLLFAVVTLLVLSLVATYIGLQLLGYRFYQVRSGSMEPALEKGDVVAVKALEPRLVAGSDVIAYKTSGGLTVVHRVREIESGPDVHSVFVDRDQKFLSEKWDYAPRTFYTKGDANPEPDQYSVPEGAVLGTVRFTVPPPLGLVATHVSRTTMFFVGVSCVLIFIAWEAAERILAGRRSGSKAPVPGVLEEGTQ